MGLYGVGSDAQAGMWTARDRKLHRGRQHRTDQTAAPHVPLRILLDLGFNSSMTDRELRSLALQASSLYGIVSRSSVPARLILTSCDLSAAPGAGEAVASDTPQQRFCRALRASAAEAWDPAFVQFDPRDFASIHAEEAGDRAGDMGRDECKSDCMHPDLDEGLGINGNASGDGGKREEVCEDGAVSPCRGARGVVATAHHGPCVYLSPDGEEVLDCVESGTTYVLGGIVDRTHSRNLSASRARIAGVRTARLPLREHGGFPTGRPCVLNIDTAARIVLAVHTALATGTGVPQAALNGAPHAGDADVDGVRARVWGEAIRRCVPARLMAPHRTRDEQSALPPTREVLGALTPQNLRQLNLKGRLLQSHPGLAFRFEREEQGRGVERWTTRVIDGDGKEVGVGKGPTGKCSDSIAAWEALRYLEAPRVGSDPMGDNGIHV